MPSKDLNLKKEKKSQRKLVQWVIQPCEQKMRARVYQKNEKREKQTLETKGEGGNGNGGGERGEKEKEEEGDKREIWGWRKGTGRKKGWRRKRIRKGRR